jgi:hypothetical protein
MYTAGAEGQHGHKKDVSGDEMSAGTFAQEDGYEAGEHARGSGTDMKK